MPHVGKILKILPTERTDYAGHIKRKTSESVLRWKKGLLTPKSRTATVIEN